ncbi:Rop family plasmid primer RNA-binding protein [Klebsiella pneumoniae]|nr:Rop family plasmid primer RNA-binding protein [Klebsiella pneumoniae]
MTKQEKTALNMAKFIKEQSLLLLDKLNELDMDTPADGGGPKADDDFAGIY